MGIFSPRAFATSLAALALFRATLGLAAPDRVVMSRFTGLTGGNQPLMQLYIPGTNGGWQALPMQAFGEPRMRDNFRLGMYDCIWEHLKTVIQQMQVTTIEKYVETGLTDLPGAVGYLKDFLKYTDRPIAFFHYLSDTPPPSVPEGGNSIRAYRGTETRTEHFPFGQARIEVSHEGRPPVVFGLEFSHPPVKGLLNEPLPKEGYVRGTLYVMGGQKVAWDPELGYQQTSPVPLPFTDWAPFQEKLKTVFNRDKYKYVFELGRGSGTAPGEFSQLMKLGGAEGVRQAMHYGVPDPKIIDDTWFAMHTTTKENTQSVREDFPDCEVLHSDGDSNDTLFLVPARRLLARHKPESASAALKTFNTVVRPDNPAQGIAFIEALKFVQASPAAMVYKGHVLDKPLLINTLFSNANIPDIHTLAARFGVSPFQLEALRSAGFLEQVRAVPDPILPGVVVDPGTAYSIPDVTRYRAIQISNLDPDLAARDPNYPLAALVATFDRMVDPFDSRIRGVDSPQVKAFADQLKRQGVQFMITTHYPSTANMLRHLKSGRVDEVPLNGERYSQIYWNEVQKHGGGARPKTKDGKLVETVSVFTVDDVLRIRRWLYRKANGNPSQLPQASPGQFWMSLSF